MGVNGGATFDEKNRAAVVCVTMNGIQSDIHNGINGFG